MTRTLFLGSFGSEGTYTTTQAWPANIHLQGGKNGFVISHAGGYYTAYFEVFPQAPSTFIRGEGATVEQAEQAAWDQYQKILNCPAHEFETRGYLNGLGFCKHCGMSKAGAFAPVTTCCICGAPTYYSIDSEGKMYCQEHLRDKPVQLWLEADWLMVDLDYFQHTGQGWLYL